MEKHKIKKNTFEKTKRKIREYEKKGKRKKENGKK
jgi:hypothetical protein